MEEISKEQHQKILRERARKLARPVTLSSSSQTSVMHMVVLLLGREVYCIESCFVTELLIAKDITPIPGTPTFIEGVINLRGQIIAMMNLKKILNLKGNDIHPSSKAMIVSEPNHFIMFGLLVDQILGTIDVLSSDIGKAPHNLTDQGSEFIKGVLPNGAIVIDASVFITSKKLMVNQSKIATTI